MWQGAEMYTGMDSMPCFRCGVCCTKYEVYLSLIEGRRIADELGLSWDEFLYRYVSQNSSNPESFILRRNEKACVFLENVGNSNTSRCLIHPFKPSACREWNPSLYRRDCQEGLTKYWGLTVSPFGLPEGPEQNLRRFHSLLESLSSPEIGDIPRKVRLRQAISY